MTILQVARARRSSGWRRSSFYAEPSGRCAVHPVSRIAKNTSRTVKRGEMNPCILAAAWEIRAGSVRH